MRFLTITAASVAVAAFMLTTPVAQAAGPIVIKFSHVVAENTPKGQMANKFKELVEQRLPGKVKVEVFPNTQLFDDDAVLSAMLLGDVQLAAPSLSKFDKYTSQLPVFDLPFLFKDIAAADRFQQSPAGQKLLLSMEKKGLIGLGYLHNGMKQLSANKPLKTPADAKGQKFRIQQSDVLAAQFEAVGAVPLMRPSRLHPARARDVRARVLNFRSSVHEVHSYTPYLPRLIDYMVVPGVLLDGIRRSPGVARRLDEPSLMNKVLDKDWATESRRRAHPDIQLTDAERAQWVEAMKPVWKKFEKDIGKDLIDAAAASNSGS